MRKQMEVEDNIFSEFEDMQREIMQYKEKLAEVEQVTSEKIAIAEQEVSEAKQKIAMAEQETSVAKQKIAVVEQEARKIVARNLKVAGIAAETIMQATGLPREEIEEL